jgi:hypothetical protein
VWARRALLAWLPPTPSGAWITQGDLVGGRKGCPAECRQCSSHHVGRLSVCGGDPATPFERAKSALVDCRFQVRATWRKGVRMQQVQRHAVVPQPGGKVLAAG